MSESAKDIQLLELKDTIAQLNNLIKNQSEIMAGLQKTIDNLRLELSNKQSELDYCKAKLFGASSEKSKTPFEFLLESRPNEKMTDEQLDSLSPWNENVKQICQNNS